MKPVALLTCCFWIFSSVLCQAQTSDAAALKVKKMDDALVDYSYCLAESLRTNAAKILAPQSLADAALKECISKRQALISAHSLISGEPETFSAQVVTSLERKLFSDKIPNYSVENTLSSAENSEKINLNYYACIHESYDQGARSSVDRAVLIKDVEKKCKPQRDATYNNAVQTGASAEKALKTTQDFTDQIFVMAELNHADIIGSHIKYITFFRGSTEFCDDAIKEKTSAREQDYLSRLATFDVRFNDKATLSRITRLHYDLNAKGMVEEYGTKKFCLFAKATLRNMGVKVSDYFQQ